MTGQSNHETPDAEGADSAAVRSPPPRANAALATKPPRTQIRLNTMVSVPDPAPLLTREEIVEIVTKQIASRNGDVVWRAVNPPDVSRLEFVRREGDETFYLEPNTPVFYRHELDHGGQRWFRGVIAL